MKVPLSWLREYVDITVPAEELAQRLTMAGTEVSAIETVGASWENIVVAQVTGLRPHPNADRLQLIEVDLGNKRRTVVAGAFNVREGDKVPLALVGASVIDGHSGEPTRVKAARIRGVVSEGMACSEKELGLSDDHSGIMVLPAEAPLGAPLAEYLGDAILDLELTPNRPDCLAIIGVAREVAALTGQRVREPEVAYEEASAAIDEAAQVKIDDAGLCPRYCASLIRGVRIGPSPPWLQRRLQAVGMRPINNVVDITNYVMLEYGQPLHAFDFDTISQGKIIVRCAHQGEVLTTLDGVTRPLAPDMLLITDPSGPIALAGVMGGAPTEVTEATRDVLLESANFNPTCIRRTSRRLRLLSEASTRFERGVSPELPLPALRRATQLILELAGGEAACGIIDSYPGRLKRPPLLLHPNRLRRILGLGLSLERIRDTLASLGFGWEEVETAEGPALSLVVPYWRTDVSIVEDVVEEVARIIGYDEVPTTLPTGKLPLMEPDPLWRLRERLRDQLAALGLQEVISYSLVSRSLLERSAGGIALDPEPVRVANPMSSEQEYLRTSLRGGLLATLARNERHQEGGIRLYEVGRVFLPRKDDLPREREMAAAVLAGPRAERRWQGEPGNLDFFDAKGALEALLLSLGVEASFVEAEDALLQPGRTAAVMVKGSQVGWLGELRPALAKAFDIWRRPVALFELDLEALLPATSVERRYQPVSRFPAAVRDLALVMDDEVPSSRAQSIIAASALVREVNLFDVYRGDQVPPGKKSLAFRVVYQSLERTLNDDEVNREQGRLLSRLEGELGASLRT